MTHNKNLYNIALIASAIMIIGELAVILTLSEQQ